MDIANQISKGLAKKAVVAKVDSAAWDLLRPLQGDCALQLLCFEDAEGKEVRCPPVGLAQVGAAWPVFECICTVRSSACYPWLVGTPRLLARPHLPARPCPAPVPPPCPPAGFLALERPRAGAGAGAGVWGRPDHWACP